MTDIALKLDAFTYQQFADGRTLMSGADGKPLAPGLYAIDFGGQQTIVRVEARRKAADTPSIEGFAAAERMRRGKAPLAYSAPGASAS